MATTIPPVTGWAPLYGNSPNAYQMQSARSSNDYYAAMALGRSGQRGVRRIMRVLLGAAPGGAAVEQYTRRRAAQPFNHVEQSGNVPMEVFTEVNRNTAAGDVSYINTNIIDRIYAMTPPLASYPPDLSGNGGGGKRGY